MRHPPARAPAFLSTRARAHAHTRTHPLIPRPSASTQQHACIFRHDNALQARPHRVVCSKGEGSALLVLCALRNDSLRIIQGARARVRGGGLPRAGWLLTPLLFLVINVLRMEFSARRVVCQSSFGNGGALIRTPRALTTPTGSRRVARGVCFRRCPPCALNFKVDLQEVSVSAAPQE